MATKKGKSKGNVKVGQLKVKTTKVKTNEQKKVKGGAGGQVHGGWDVVKNVKP